MTRNERTQLHLLRFKYFIILAFKPCLCETISYVGSVDEDQTAHAQSDLGLRCPLAESLDTIENI